MGAVSYTHLDVYKRQIHCCMFCSNSNQQNMEPVNLYPSAISCVMVFIETSIICWDVPQTAVDIGTTKLSVNGKVEMKLYCTVGIVWDLLWTGQSLSDVRLKDC